MTTKQKLTPKQQAALTEATQAIRNEAINYVLARQEKGLITWKWQINIYVNELLDVKRIINKKNFKEVKYDNDMIDYEELTNSIYEYVENHDTIVESHYYFINIY